MLKKVASHLSQSVHESETEAKPASQDYYKKWNKLDQENYGESDSRLDDSQE
jgi:hypothetical protein